MGGGTSLSSDHPHLNAALGIQRELKLDHCGAFVSGLLVEGEFDSSGRHLHKVATQPN